MQDCSEKECEKSAEPRQWANSAKRNADENSLLNCKYASLIAELDCLRSQIDALKAENQIVVEDLKAAKMLSALNERDVLMTKLKVLVSGARVYP